MELAEEKLEAGRIISIKGRLDALTWEILETRLAELDADGERRLLIDCTGMDYISSSGLRVLLTGLKRTRQAGGRLLLCGLRENIREIFDISGFSALFEILPGRVEGIGKLNETK